jgi:hypothetical protein
MATELTADELETLVYRAAERVKSWYPTSVFPEDFARLTVDQVVREFEKLKAKAEGNNG